MLYPARGALRLQSDVAICNIGVACYNTQVCIGGVWQQGCSFQVDNNGDHEPFTFGVRAARGTAPASSRQELRARSDAKASQQRSQTLRTVPKRYQACLVPARKAWLASARRWNAGPAASAASKKRVFQYACCIKAYDESRSTRYSLPLSILSIVFRAEPVLVVNPREPHFWLCRRKTSGTWPVASGQQRSPYSQL